VKKHSRRDLLRRGTSVGGGALIATAGCANASDLSVSGPPGPAILGGLPVGCHYVLFGDGSDSTALWQEALDSIGRAGRGAIRVSGEHVITQELRLPDAQILEIIGDGAAVLRKADAGQEFRIFANDRAPALPANLVIRDLHFVGDWDEVSSMGGDHCRCIAVHGYRRVALRDLTAEAFRNMTFTADNCDEVLVESCRVMRSARDPINLTGSRFVKVVNCTIQNAWDDAIAVHVPRDVVDENSRYATIISNNQILQSNGIKVLGGPDVTITGNQIIAPNNYGIFLGEDTHWREGGVPHRNVVIANNIVSETISYEYLRGQGQIGAGIYFADAGRRLLSTRIHGNIITKYKPDGAGVYFSHWGFGPYGGERRFFTSEGWTDPELVHGHKGKGIGIRVIAANASDTTEIAIESNSFANLALNIDRVER
jgi:Right handed beta helix region